MGNLSGIGTGWNLFTGYLGASDGEYLNKCINKIFHRELELEKLMKNRISVTTSVIKNFNVSIHKYQTE